MMAPFEKYQLRLYREDLKVRENDTTDKIR